MDILPHFASAPPDLALQILRAHSLCRSGNSNAANDSFTAAESFGMNLACGVAIAQRRERRDGWNRVAKVREGRRSIFRPRSNCAGTLLPPMRRCVFAFAGPACCRRFGPVNRLRSDPVEFSDIRPGDLAVFVRNRQFIVHRVVRRTVGARGVAIVTRGDAELHDDPPFDATELLGVVATVHRFGASRPVRRRLPMLARGVAWIIQRSSWVRSVLTRLNSVRIRRGWALSNVPCCANAPHNRRSEPAV